MLYKLHIKPRHEARVIFCLLGFKTREAFIEVCLDIDQTVDFRDCYLAWDLGLITAAFEQKFERILEALINE